MYRPLNLGCLHKIHISNTNGDRYVNCGQCISCRLRKSNRLARLGYLDALKCDNVFVTLTYDNVHLPWCDCFLDSFTNELIFYKDDEILSRSYCTEKRYKNTKIISRFYQNVFGLPRDGSFRVPILLQEHQQTYVKRVRERYRKKFHCFLRFQICGEYGPTTQRPHYHILFQIPRACNDSNRDAKTEFLASIASECWEFGNSYVECSDNAVSSYISTYITSSSSYSIPTHNTCFKPFFRHSNKFGFGYVSEDSEIYQAIWDGRLPSVARTNKKGQNYEVSLLPFDYLRSFLPLPSSSNGFDDARTFARLQFAMRYYTEGYRPSQVAKIVFDDYILPRTELGIEFRNKFEYKENYLKQNDFELDANNNYLYNWIYRNCMVSYKYYKWWKFFGYNHFVTESFYRLQYYQAKSDCYTQQYENLKENDISDDLIAMFMSDEFNLYKIPDMMPKYMDYYVEIYNRYHHKDKSKKFNDLYFNKVELI
nr:replication initiation protein [Microvirus sp.]